MTTETRTDARCRNCGSRLPDRPLSICPYCVMPLGLGKEVPPSGEASPHAARIQKVAEHADTPALMEWTPPESPRYWDGVRASYRGRLAVGLGAASMLLGFGLAGSGALGHPATWIGVLFVAWGAFAWHKGRTVARAATSLTLLKRAALITDRRSTTSLGTLSGRTTYHFTIELEGGVQGEFDYPGRGSHEEPYVTNLPGVAYTRGNVLLAFRHVRV